jgi:hypothetical protein
MGQQQLARDVQSISAARNKKSAERTALMRAKSTADALQEYAKEQEKVMKRVAAMQSQLAINAGIKRRIEAEMQSLSNAHSSVRLHLQAGLGRQQAAPCNSTTTTSSTSSSSSSMQRGGARSSGGRQMLAAAAARNGGF